MPLMRGVGITVHFCTLHKFSAQVLCKYSAEYSAGLLLDSLLRLTEEVQYLRYSSCGAFPGVLGSSWICKVVETLFELMMH
jgi:hypothetical protein